MSTININENLDIGRYSTTHTNNLLYTIENPEGIYNNNNFIFIHGLGYSNSYYNVGFAIKKDPFIINPIDSLRSETMSLYSFDKDLNRVKGNYSEYALKLWVYPATDLSDIVTLTSVSEVKNMAGITNSVSIMSYSSAGYSEKGWYIPKGLTETSNRYSSLAEMFKSGKMGVSRYSSSAGPYTYDINDEYACHVCYDIDISTLGINYPSNEERGINEETLQLFNSDNFLGFHDAKTLDILKSSGIDNLRYYLSYGVYSYTNTIDNVIYTIASTPIIFYNYNKTSNNNRINYLGIYSGIGNMINGYSATNGYCIPNPFSSFFIATLYGPCLIVPGVVKITGGA